MYRKREPYNGKKQFKVLMKIIQNKELYKEEDLNVLEYLKQKWFIDEGKVNNNGKKYILFIEKLTFDMKSYWLYMLIIFWLPFILTYFWKYIPIDWMYWFIFYFFMITFWIFFLMKKNWNKRKEHIKNFKNKYFN